MAKQKKEANTLIRPSALSDSYIKITPANRKHCIVLGRVIHIIEHKNPTYHDKIGSFDIRPRLSLEKHWLLMNNFIKPKIHEVFIFSEESPESYKEQFEDILKHGISRGIFYIKKEERLVSYTFNKERTIAKTEQHATI